MEIRARHMRELERMFSAEVYSALNGGSGLIQSRANVYKELEEMGLAMLSTQTVAVDRFGPMNITGYELTHAGRLAWCASCSDEPEPHTTGDKP